ncbi:MAG: efflux RND transporter periplasmic adaptor subunit [Cyclobacteriaceae bacterium]
MTQLRKKKSNNRLLYILLGVVGILVIFAVIGKSQGWVGKKKEMEVQTSKVEKSRIIEKVSASGTVQPVLEVKISPEVAGEIIELAIEEGDSVQKDAFMLKIRPDNFISALERARANLNQQRANLADARARLARAEANNERSRLEFERQKKLFDEKVISNSDFELADANFKISQQDLKSAEQSVEAAKYILLSSDATVREAEKNLGLTEIQSPMTGIVSKLDVELGETVVGTSQMQGTEMLRIADMNNMEVRVDVNENDIIRITQDDTVVIDVDSYSYLEKEFKGVVTQIASTANPKVSSDAVTEFEVRIKILNDSYKDLLKERGIQYPFRPGMTASVDIITEVKKDILTVPLSAVTTRNPNDAKAGEENEDKKDGEDLIIDEEVEEVVFIYENGVAKKVKVRTGISDFDRIEILEGLKVDDVVISGPFLAVSKRLKDGELVKDPSIEQEKSEVAENEEEVKESAEDDD